MRDTQRPAPSLAYLPGLRSQPFWQPSDFPWMQSLKDALPAIRNEYAALAATSESDYALKAHEQELHRGNWSWHSFVTKGNIQPAFQVKCPETASLLQRVPDLLTGIPFAYAFFSAMNGSADIAPHFGPCNLRLRVHVPLLVPSVDVEQCGIRVASESRAWSEPLVFDDTYEHCTWNRTNQPRVVLLFDVWHPEVTEPERAAVRDMFDHARQQGWLT